MDKVRILDNGRIEYLSEEEIRQAEVCYLKTLADNGVTDDVIKKEKKKKSPNGELLEIRAEIDEAYQKELDRFATFKEVVDDDTTIPGEFDDFHYELQDEGSVVVRKIVITPNAPHLIKNRIEELKRSLQNTDYVVIKTYEAKLTNGDSPYSSDELDEIFAKRDVWRKQINELEARLAK